ncbi:hypothetical protein LABALGNA3A7_09820 [Dellaglioa algida]|nr:hypothetical protein LABALGNA3A7_09820 [Dellaglioa algida]
MMGIIIDAKSDEEMLLSIIDRSDIEAPEAEYETEYVDGKDGSINRFKYYKDIEQTIEFNILEDFNIKPQIRKIKAWLLNAKSFYFTDDDVLRKVKQVKIDGIKNSIAEYGVFTVAFTCDPFEYMREDKMIDVKNGSDIENIGTYKSLPLIKVYGNGKGTLSVGRNKIAVDLQKEYMLMDSEIKECYYTATNLGSYMTGEFIELIPGKNKLVFNGGVTKVEIQRRCRYL